MGLLNIIALSYLSIISIVVFLHYFNRKANTIYVPSIIPWQTLKTDVVTSRLFRINLLFLLQVFLIILLSFFLARPYLHSDILVMHGHNKVVVVDTSASMQTIEKDGSRFDQVKEGILDIINKMKTPDKMMIISAYSSSEVFRGLTGDKELLRKSVEMFKPTDTATDLEGGISLALSYMENMKNSQLYVLTDQRIESCGVKIEELDPESFQFTRIGKSDENVAISSFDTFQDLFNETDEAYITVKNSSWKPKEVKLTVYLEEDILMEKKLILDRQEQKTLTVQNISLPGVLKAEIETDDDLKVDNVAFGMIKKRKKFIDIIMVTDSNKLKMEFQRLEKAFSKMRIKMVSVDEYDPNISGNYDISIFHKYVPDKQPAINSMFITPDIIDNNEPEAPSLTKGLKEGAGKSVYASLDNGEVWPSYLTPKGTIRNVQIVDWDNKHPTMKYLDYLDNIKTDNALLYKQPKGATILIYASGEVFWSESIPFQDGLRNDLPLLFSLKQGNKRTVVMGLDLEEFRYSDTNNMPILIMTLNMIQWLSPLGDNLDSFGRSNLAMNNQLKTGDLYPIHSHDDFEGLNIIGNDGTMLPVADVDFLETDSVIQSFDNRKKSTTEVIGVLSMPADNNLAVDRFSNYATIKHAGVYVVKMKDKERRFVANLFDKSESNINPLEQEKHNDNAKLKTAQISDNMPLISKKEEINDISRYILYFVPLLLIVEWIYSFVRTEK